MKARLIVTMDCNRKCAGCCNSYSKIMSGAKKINSILEIPKKCTEVLITGGEPLLYPEKTLDIISEVKKRFPDGKIYLYTAFYNKTKLDDILSIINGIHYTVHAEATKLDLKGFYRMQKHLNGYDISKRLYIDPVCKIPVLVDYYNLWDVIGVDKWKTETELLKLQEGGLPEGETLYILDKESK